MRHIRLVIMQAIAVALATDVSAVPAIPATSERSNRSRARRESRGVLDRLERRALGIRLARHNQIRTLNRTILRTLTLRLIVHFKAPPNA